MMKTRTNYSVVPPKKAVHYTANYIIDPPHPVTINVIGCGGTGSQVLNSLARMHSALKALGHPGLFVKAIDPDKVSSANMGRQLFSPADVDAYKCMVLIGRINRFFGTDWEGIPLLYNSKTSIATANITISCVDTGAARKEIKYTLSEATKLIKDGTPYATNRGYMHRSGLEPYQVPYYWMDFGNMMDRGQVVIGTVCKIEQPKKSEFDCKNILPTIDKLHPDIFKDNKKDDQGPSCSLAEALSKQDLFINTNLANMGLCILWKMFREMHIKYHGLYLNLQSMNVNPIAIN
jgi:PRTRC genetic system ThiF family protein